MSELEIWRNAVQLHEAYAVFASDEQKALFRQAGDRLDAHASFELMFADLFYALSAGELYAIGFAVSGMATDPPMQLPTHFFDGRPNISECQNGVIIFQNWRFENVRIFKSDCKNIVDLKQRIIVSNTNLPVGRTDTYILAKDVLFDLFSENPLLKNNNANELLTQFNVKYRAMASRMGKPAADLSERTLRKHLKRFRKESE